MDKVFKALGDPSRRQLLDRLHADNGQTLGQLCAFLEMSRQAVTKHLVILEDANLVVIIWRGREKLHYLEAEKLKTVHDWVKAFEELWGHQLDRIKERAEHRAREQTESPPPLI